MDRLSDREAFRRLRTEGRRHRSGPLSLVVRVDPDDHRAGLAFAVPRKVGSAVTRNRLRRRLREIFRALEREGLVPAGDYLVLVSPEAAALDHRGLRHHVERALRRADGRA